MWDIYGLLQLFGGGALLGGGLVWNLFRGGYERLRDVNGRTLRWRRILDWVIRAFRAIQEDGQGGQNAGGAGAEGDGAVGQAGDNKGRLVNLAPLDQVVFNNNAGGAVNIDDGQMLRDQDDELRDVEQLLMQRNLELRQVKQELLGLQQQQQQQENQQQLALNNAVENELNDNRDRGVNLPALDIETPRNARPRNDRPGPSGSRIPLPLPLRQEESLSSSSSDIFEPSTGEVTTDSSTITHRSTRRPTASSWLLLVFQWDFRPLHSLVVKLQLVDSAKRQRPCKRR